MQDEPYRDVTSPPPQESDARSWTIFFLRHRLDQSPWAPNATVEGPDVLVPDEPVVVVPRSEAEALAEALEMVLSRATHGYQDLKPAAVLASLKSPVAVRLAGYRLDYPREETP